jgi:hypothetical protein
MHLGVLRRPRLGQGLVEGMPYLQVFIESFWTLVRSRRAGEGGDTPAKDPHDVNEAVLSELDALIPLILVQALPDWLHNLRHCIGFRGFGLSMGASK